MKAGEILTTRGLRAYDLSHDTEVRATRNLWSHRIGWGTALVDNWRIEILDPPPEAVLDKHAIGVIDIRPDGVAEEYSVRPDGWPYGDVINIPAHSHLLRAAYHQ